MMTWKRKREPGVKRSNYEKIQSGPDSSFFLYSRKSFEFALTRKLDAELNDIEIYLISLIKKNSLEV